MLTTLFNINQVNYIKTHRAIKDTNNVTNHSNHFVSLCHTRAVCKQMFNCISILTGNRTIVVVNGSEDYTTIAESFRDVFQEINEVQEDGFVKVGETQTPVEVFLGGDYKVSKYCI